MTSCLAVSAFADTNAAFRPTLGPGTRRRVQASPHHQRTGLWPAFVSDTGLIVNRSRVFFLAASLALAGCANKSTPHTGAVVRPATCSRPTGLGSRHGHPMPAPPARRSRALRLAPPTIRSTAPIRPRSGTGPLSLRRRRTLALLAALAFAQTTTQRPANPQMRSTGGGADMSCPGDKVVWVNTKKRDLPLQGRTLVRQHTAGQIHVRARRRRRRRSPDPQRAVGNRPAAASVDARYFRS